MGATKKIQVSPDFNQWGVVSGIFFNELGQGMASGIVTAIIVAGLAHDTDIRITMEIASWLGPITLIGAMVTLPVSSYLMTKIGRRVTYILMSIPVLIGLVMNAYSYDNFTLLLGRFLCGITLGCSGVLASMIIGEFASPQYRGTFLVLKISFFNLGIYLVHLLTYYIHWRVVSFAVAAPFIISIMITFTWPESPYWLAENEKLEESEEAFYWLRGRNQDSTREFDEIVKNQQNKGIKKTFFENIRELFMKFTKKNFWKPFVVIVLTSTMMVCSGILAFPTYTYFIIEDLRLNMSNLLYYNIAIISITIVSSFISAYLVRVFKLRPLLFTTGFVAVVDLYLISLFLHLASNGTLTKEYSWIPISLLGLFFIVINLACSLVPMTVAGEIFPPEHRAVGATVQGYVVQIAMIVAFKITSLLVMNVRTYGAFIFFASGLLLSLLGLYVMLPETKDKTLLEIDEFFTHDDRSLRKRVAQREQDDVEQENQTVENSH